MKKILLAEDDRSTREGIVLFLKSRGHETRAVDNGEAALKELENSDYDFLITDMKMPKLSGKDLLVKARSRGCRIPTIIITAFASIKDAVEAMKLGADDYLMKPLNLEELNLRIERLMEKRNLLLENKELKEKLYKETKTEWIGMGKSMGDLRKQIKILSNDPDVSVVISGESGTGKELTARSIHFGSFRENAPFVAVNCAAVPETLFESEFFGHKKGAFTGAYHDKKGYFEVAHNGTLFLDEVSELTLRQQAKLLRVLQEYEITPVGGTKSIKIKIRLICATNRPLLPLVQSKQFRKDLFYRISVVNVHIPPLRNRVEDIPLLINHFLNELTTKSGKSILFSKQAYQFLQNYSWPGNIRELQNVVKNIHAINNDGLVNVEDLPIYNDENKFDIDLKEDDYKASLRQAIIHFEKDFLTYHLKRNQWNISKTAQSINISRVSLHSKIKTLGLEP